MADLGWTHAASPFHRGEQEAQARVGVRDKVDGFGRRFIRDHMPDQHRAFYRALPFLVLGTVDAEGWPWASIVSGHPGFVSSPDARHLVIAARPLEGDPLAANLVGGAEVGILGIELETRRRNRMSGTVVPGRTDAITIAVRQAFGNCPQYIQSRAVSFDAGADAAPTPPGVRSEVLDAPAQRLIRQADTLFIATTFAEGSGDRATGADVSHRGGKPGFVCGEDDRTLIFPDYAGNFHFNTIGNILLNPKAGLLFLDFESGDLLSLTARAEIVWDGEAVEAFAGAQRLLRFHVVQALRLPRRLPLRFSFRSFAPALEDTGSWEQAQQTIAASRERNRWAAQEVFRVERESETVTSFYLRPAESLADGPGDGSVDRRPVAGYRPGQFLPIRIVIPDREQPAVRTYTLSDAPGSGHYRLSVKREEGGLVSGFLHDRVTAGFRLEAMAPRGTFFLDEADGSARGRVLISAGVGITPMLAIVNHLFRDGRHAGQDRPTVFIHGARSGRTLAFGAHLRALAKACPSLTVHIRFSRPEAGDRLGESHDSVGRIDTALLTRLVPRGEHDFYLCGPADFLRSLYGGLRAQGVLPDRIHYESFGASTVLDHHPPAPRDAAAGGGVADPVRVRFARSGQEAAWSPEDGTLLEFAESLGLAPRYGCRAGICGSCATRLRCGGVDYVDSPVAMYAPDEVLICCAVPGGAAPLEQCGAFTGIVLDL